MALADAVALSVDELDTMLAEGQPVDHGQSGSSELRRAGELRDTDTSLPLPAIPSRDDQATDARVPGQDCSRVAIATPRRGQSGDRRSALSFAGGVDRGEDPSVS
ncbi:MAG: hypothetical protein ACRDRW_14890 [Pseudonocardiaceae bacterium]